MAVHCAAMQGRADVVQVLVRQDRDGLIRKALAEEKRSPPSVVNLALANDFIECAEWCTLHEPLLLVQTVLQE